MIQELKRSLIINKNNLIAIPLVSLGICLFGYLLCAFIAILAGPEGVPVLGSLFWYIGVACSGIGITLALVVSMNLALQMGATRRQYILVNVLLALVAIFICLLLTPFVQLIDKAFVALFPSSILFFKPSMPLTIAATFFSVVAGTLLGSVMARFGRAGIYVMIGFWTLFGLISGNIFPALSTDRSDLLSIIIRTVAHFLTVLPTWGLWTLGACVILLLFFVCWLMLRRIEVQ